MESDPHGFARVRNELDSLYPSLRHVATSSMGASIKDHIAEYHMPPEAITRAFLASAGMEKDSLGARIIESKHTGRWRYACTELHKFLHEYTSPGTASAGFASGREEQRVDHTGATDRNAFLYAMLEVELSMGIGRDSSRLDGDADRYRSFTALEMYDEMCGYGNADADGPAGWRVAQATWRPRPIKIVSFGQGFYTRRVPDGVPEVNYWGGSSDASTIAATDVASFAPIVGYGSLEMLQSMKMAALGSCQEGFGEEDAETAMVCNSNDVSRSAVGPFQRSLFHRASHAPFTMQRDVWCNPEAHLSVESTVGNPLMFTQNLYDTPYKEPFWINYYRVYASDRGEEFIDGTFKQYNLMSWVYVTSSGDPRLRAGMHRLRDLPVFRTTPCSELPGVQCNLRPGWARHQQAQRDRLANMFYVAQTTHRTAKILNQVALIDAASTDSAHSKFVTGREGIVKHRCSDTVASAIGFYECNKQPYNKPGQLALAGCYTGDLTLGSTPGKYSSSYFYDRLGRAPDPPLPPPPPAPNPPPPPPSPSPAPSPPRLYDPDEIKEQVRAAEERVCTSVYFLSQTTRCERLAIDLTERLLIHWSPPPSPVPAPPLAPRLPPPPPSPSLPEGLEVITLSTVTLSTMRMPQLRLGDADTVDGFYTDDAALHTRIGAESRGHRACVSSTAPLGCITASLPERCLNGEQRCSTAYDNGFNPTLDAYFRMPAGYYLWGVRVSLPSNDQLAELFVGTKTVQLFGPGATPIACQEGGITVVGVPASREMDILCQAPTATDDDIRTLATVDRMRLTLTGEYRQIWLAAVRPIVRSMAAAGVERASPPPPTLTPAAPPSPSEPAASACVFSQGSHVVSVATGTTTTHEPCNLDVSQCCDHAVELGAQGFALDDAGCCDLYFYTVAPTRQTSTLVTGRWSAGAGFGTVL